MMKFWKVAEMQKHNRAQQYLNNTLGTNFPFLIAKVKALIASDKPFVFERNYIKDPSESLTALYAFVAPTVYFNLECDGAYDYQMQYAFGNCKQEQEIRKLLLHYGLTDKATERMLPDYDTFYQNVMAAQGKHNFHILG